MSDYAAKSRRHRKVHSAWRSIKKKVNIVGKGRVRQDGKGKKKQLCVCFLTLSFYFCIKFTISVPNDDDNDDDDDYFQECFSKLLNLRYFFKLAKTSQYISGNS